MQDQMVTGLQTKLEQHFTKRIAEITSAIQQAIIKDSNNPRDEIGIHMLSSYIEQIKAEHKNIMEAMKDINNPEQLAKLLGQYLNDRFKAVTEDDSDLSQAAPVIFSDRAGSSSIKHLKEIQAALTEYVATKGNKL